MFTKKFTSVTASAQVISDLIHFRFHSLPVCDCRCCYWRREPGWSWEWEAVDHHDQTSGEGEGPGGGDRQRYVPPSTHHYPSPSVVTPPAWLVQGTSHLGETLQDSSLCFFSCSTWSTWAHVTFVLFLFFSGGRYEIRHVVHDALRHRPHPLGHPRRTQLGQHPPTEIRPTEW